MSIQIGELKAEKEKFVDQREQNYLDKKIKKAYQDNDAGASRAAHEEKLKQMGNDKYSAVDITDVDSDGKHDDNEQEWEISEEHGVQETKHKGDADGIITLFAIVASISGSDLNVETVLVLGFAKLVGDGISMGVGDFLSEKAEIDFVKSEYQREKWEFDNYKEGEIKEMIDIYKDKGFSDEDATLIIRTMSKYPKFFVDHMMMEELELDCGVIEDNPLKNGGITFISFLVFGTVPLLSYLVFHGIDVDEGGTDWKLIIAVILTCICLFGMGAVKGYYCNTNVLKSGFFVMLNGALAAGSAYLIGWGLSEALGVHGVHG